MKSSSDHVDEDDPKLTFSFKALYFMMYGSFGAIYPYRALFYETCGYSPSMIGLLCMMPNMASFLFAPTFNSLADYHDVKFEMMSSSIFGMITSQIPLIWYGSYEVICMWLVAFNAAVGSPIGSLIDSMVISNLKYPGDFGKMRQWGAISFGIMSFLGGASLEGAKKTKASFVWIFLIHIGFALLAVALLMRVRKLIRLPPTDSEEQARNTAEKGTEAVETAPETIPKSKSSTLSLVTTLFREKPVVFVFCIVVFCSGLGAGVIDSFLFVRLEELGGSGTLCGIARFITCAAEVPAFQVAGDLQKRYGTWVLLAFTQMIFVARFLCYSALRNPWLVLLIEPLNGATFAITWSVSCMYADSIAPEGTHATMQALLEAMHFGLGCGVGSLAAGFVYESHGAVICFLSAGVLSCFSCALASVTYFYQDLHGEEEQGEDSGANREARRPSETALNKDVELAGINSRHGLLGTEEELGTEEDDEGENSETSETELPEWGRRDKEPVQEALTRG